MMTQKTNAADPTPAEIKIAVDSCPFCAQAQALDWKGCGPWRKDADGWVGWHKHVLPPTFTESARGEPSAAAMARWLPDGFGADAGLTPQELEIAKAMHNDPADVRAAKEKGRTR
jgi:hypothetical protein